MGPHPSTDTNDNPPASESQPTTFVGLREAWADKPAGLMRHVDRLEDLLEYHDERTGDIESMEAHLVQSLLTEIEPIYPMADIRFELTWMCGYGSGHRPDHLRGLVADLPPERYFDGHLIELLAAILTPHAKNSEREQRALNLLIEFWECARRADEHDWDVLEGAIGRLCSGTEQTGRECYDWETLYADR